MKFGKYQRQSFTAVQEHDSVKDAVVHWTVGLTEEAGEVASLIKHRYFNGEKIDDFKIAEELGDVLWYIAAICSELNIDLNTVAHLNIDKLKFRYIGGEYDEKRVQERETLDALAMQSDYYGDLKKKLYLKNESEE